MGWLRRLFDRGDGSAPSPSEQAVIIKLDGTSLPDSVYEECDTATLEEMLQDHLGFLGDCDGVEHGPTESRIFLYGEDAEEMFSAVEPALRAYPLAANAVVTLRFGPPGAPQRQVRLEE